MFNFYINRAFKIQIVLFETVTFNCHKILKMSKKMKTAFNELLSKYSTSKPTLTLYATKINTPIGEAVAVADDDHLYLLNFIERTRIEKHLDSLKNKLNCEFVEGKTKPLNSITKELTEYFDGKRKIFETPLKTHGSQFQKDTWTQLQKIPFGTTVSYSEHASSMGKSASHARAVGNACKANMHVVVIPCHRVLASTGNLNGFGASVDRKEFLVNHENKFK